MLRIRQPLLPSPSAPTSTLVWINVSGAWKQATVWINVGGVWKQTTPFINVSGTWK